VLEAMAVAGKPGMRYVLAPAGWQRWGAVPAVE